MIKKLSCLEKLKENTQIIFLLSILFFVKIIWGTLNLNIDVKIIFILVYIFVAYIYLLKRKVSYLYENNKSTFTFFYLGFKKEISLIL